MRCQWIGTLLVLLLFTAPALAKSYQLTKADIRMQINPNGGVDATETISFQFSGDYHFAYRDIPNGPWTISEIGVTENGEPVQFSAYPYEDSISKKRVSFGKKKATRLCITPAHPKKLKITQANAKGFKPSFNAFPSPK